MKNPSLSSKSIDRGRIRPIDPGCRRPGRGLPAQRTAIACVLNRLILLTSGNEAKLAEMFARAELRRGSCAAAAGPTISADWMTGAENPVLRGAF